MRETCPFANESCKYFDKAPPPELADQQEHGCYSDKAHPFHPRGIVAKLGATAMNNALAFQQCRATHDEYHATVPYNLPTYAELKEWREARRGQSNGLSDSNGR